jgi:hypothetical protein
VAAQTAWTIMIRMASSSTAPRMFGAVTRAAEKASVATEKAEESMLAYGVAADDAAEQVGVLTAENSALARSFVVAGNASVKSAATQEASLMRTKKAGDVAHKALIGIGVTSAIVFAVGIKGASDLQNATLQSAIALGRMGGSLDQTMTKMNDFTQVAFNMSKITGQSLSDSMGVVSTMATSGLNASQIKSAATPIAQFGDLLKYGKDKMSYEQSATIGAGLVHDLRLGLSGNNARDAADMSYGLARIAQLSFMSPHGEAAVTTQIRRFAPTFEGILPGNDRQKADTIAKTAAWVDRMGNLPFAGSALSQLLTQMVMPRSERVGQSMVDLGVFQPGHMKGRTFVPGKNNFWDDKTGTFDFMGALKEMGKRIADAHKQGLKTGHVGPAVMAVFGNTQNAQRILSALTSKEAQQAWKNVNAQMSGFGKDPVAWMAQAQTQVMATLSGQVGILVSNLQTMATLLTAQLIPALTKFTNFLQLKVGKFDQALIDHPDMAKLGGEALLAGGVAGIIGLLKAGHNVIHFFASLGKEPHFGTVFSQRAGAVAGEAASGAVEAAEVTGFLGMIGKSMIGPLTGAAKGFGSKLIPVVGELGLLYTALQLLVGGFAWLNNMLGIHKQQITPLSHGDKVTSLATYRGSRIPGASLGRRDIRTQGVSHDASTFYPAVTRGGTGRGHSASNGKVSVVQHTGKITVALEGSAIKNMSVAERKALARELGDEFGKTLTRDTAYSHSGTQAVATDAYGGSNYHSDYGVPA